MSKNNIVGYKLTVVVDDKFNVGGNNKYLFFLLSRGFRQMSRVDRVLKYIGKKIKNAKADLSKVNDSIDDDFAKSIKESIGLDKEERYIDYISTLDFDTPSIAFIYLLEVYRNKKRISLLS
ncbi:hypothetical protein PY546_13210 [Providencia stuartii]|nr:hypothetical protein [Providencia stuartii]